MPEGAGPWKRLIDGHWRQQKRFAAEQEQAAARAARKRRSPRFVLDNLRLLLIAAIFLVFGVRSLFEGELVWQAFVGAAVFIAVAVVFHNLSVLADQRTRTDDDHG